MCYAKWAVELRGIAGMLQAVVKQDAGRASPTEAVVVYSQGLSGQGSFPLPVQLVYRCFSCACDMHSLPSGLR
jgi:hypothetical protein